MSYLEEWEDEENDLIPDDWTEEEEAWWNKFVPILTEALFICAKQEVDRMEEKIKDMPDIELSDDFKIKMNKLFRDNFGEDCEIPHPEVENRATVNS